MKRKPNNIDVISMEMDDGILIEIKPKQGFKISKDDFLVQFLNNNTKELLWSDIIKAGMFSKIKYKTRNDDILITITNKNTEIYSKLFPKIEESIIDVKYLEPITGTGMNPNIGTAFSSKIQKDPLNIPKVSIVIPTMQLELTKKCINSLITFTDLTPDIEIIVVANGADSEIKNYISKLFNDGINIHCSWFDKPLGAVVALNEGIKASSGEYVVLLNDDCEILHSEKNYWLNALLEPFSDPLMGCTGPFRMLPIIGGIGIDLSIEDSTFGFILFFCAMMKRKMLDEIGLLDESLKCGVDIDVCMKLKRKGYKIKQVPSDERLDTACETHYCGVYPIWHQAEATVHDFYGLDGWAKIIKEDSEILNKRWGIKKDKVSIVIPVYGNHLDDFKKCWESILANTDMSNLEVIIIANGCVEEIRNYLDEITKNNDNFKYFWYDEALGATSAINKGFENSTGDIIALLNQDVVILGNHWLQFLTDPFKDPQIGITGPVLGGNTDVNRNFILFFCAGIRRKVFDDIGMLDPIFNPGGFEDIDFSIKAENAGWKLVQVPYSNEMINNGNGFIGSFPIYHVEHHSEWMDNNSYEKNRKIILDRYAPVDNKIIDITWPCAQKKFELSMVQEFLKKERIEKVLEVGTYRGGTAMLWAHLVEPHNGKVFCCDVQFEWGSFQDLGYVGNELINYRRQIYNDTPYEKFITEFQGNSHDPSFIQHVKNNVGIVDLLFIDGDHSYEGVRQDFENFYPMLKIGGHVIFHDIVDSKHHRSFGCNVEPFWNELKEIYPNWEFIDQNEYPGCLYHSMGIGIIKKVSSDLKNIKPKAIPKSIKTNSSDVVCFIATKNRYLTALPLAIQSVIMQNVKPDKLIIYDDNTDEDKIDLRANEMYRYLFDILDSEKIKWEVIFGYKQGQHHGHQIANKLGYKYVWRLDDDEIAAPDVLEKYLNLMKDDVGAVGGSVLIKGYGGESSTKIEDIYSKANLQWTLGDKIVETDHLHSTFLYRAGIVDYCLELSPVAHREETIFTHEFKEKGYKLFIDQSAITYHLKQQSTGIRSHNSEWFFKHDEKIFTKKMESWGYKLLNLDSGLGDHYAFLNILPELKKKWKHLIIGACFPEVFKDHPDVTLIHISQSAPINDENIYKWMIDNKWDKSIVEAYARFYEVTL